MPLESIDKIEVIEIPEPAPELVSAVKNAIQQLPDDYQAIITYLFYDGLTFDEIAQKLELPPELVMNKYQLAANQLRIFLHGFVEKRWGIRHTVCCVCIHPQCERINRILRRKSPEETWSSFNRRLEGSVGAKFNPPQILIAHLKHIEPAGKERRP